MEEKPPAKNRFRTVVLPLIVATIFGGAVYIMLPEVGPLAAISAWIGTLLFMSIWASFYS